MNGFSIMLDIRKALNSYKKGEFAYFGYSIGNILELATRTVEQKAMPEKENIFNRNMVAEVAQGILESTKVGTFDFT